MSERSADPVDWATDQAARSADEAVKSQLERSRASTPSPNEDGLCVDCGDSVHVKRLRLGFGLCIECARDREQHGRTRAGTQLDLGFDLDSPDEETPRPRRRR